MNDLSTLYHELGGQLFRYAFGLTGEIHFAEDVVSETFLRAAEHCMANSSIPARAWFYKVARNIAIDCIRKNSKLVYKDPPETADSSSITNPGAALVYEEEVRQLRIAMSKLPETYRSILIMREYNELTYTEIAAVLGISMDNVKVSLFRAKQRLRELYRRYE